MVPGFSAAEICLSAARGSQCSKMCWSRAFLAGWVLLLVLLQYLQAVPIGIDKTKVKETEEKPEEPPASVVRRFIQTMKT
ncbi:hypothetical protein GOODEAATRI_018099 [Goodea atripinnis]|uniref:Uncharacterized protein n=1 Tax=Goodea atripinnis TaxID=208336 RepID=A0ABV0P5U0_9TELE